ncbi:MAG: mannose-1-phosphate guanylyltransferase [Deltaproteobacteria bacterium]|nr:MAG: mannose-1-phosphate guanylyltransferase [Deltaproteobacteria bacterium]
MAAQSTNRGRVPRRLRYAVIMAGGVGSRFWPWSRADRPKQMLSLAASRSMLAETVERLRSLVDPGNILVVTSQRIGREVRRELPSLPARNVLCEPVGRNTAPCIGWAALEILHRERNAVMVVLPADHVVKPRRAFAADVDLALAVAARERVLVTFGIRPTYPATGYGYVRATRPLGDGASGALVVDRFCEKPSRARARRFLAAGAYYWNSGMFAWRADVVLEAIARHLPELASGLQRMEARRSRGRIPATVLSRAFGRLPSVSIDYGVMEKARNAVLLPARFEWSDIGSWAAVAELWPADESGNRSRDRLIAIDAAGNVVASQGKPVALVGVEGLVVVDAGDALLVCPRRETERVREVVEEIRRRGWKDLS